MRIKYSRTIYRPPSQLYFRMVMERIVDIKAQVVNWMADAANSKASLSIFIASTYDSLSSLNSKPLEVATPMLLLSL